jgi:release factor glutamine methyltransferase
MTIRECLGWSTRYLRDHHIENSHLNAELLIGKVLGLSREEVYRRFADQVGHEEIEAYRRLTERRGSGEPLQYLLGHQQFWSLDLEVDSRVLIPRPETELLVETALSVLVSTHARPRVLEIGTGSGAIAISLAREVEGIFIVATDISREALSVARKNAGRSGVEGRIHFICGDLFAAFRIPEESGFDLILSNPPYVSRSELLTLAEEVKREPRIALDGGEDGLAFYGRILSEAPRFLGTGGWLLLELGDGQSAWIADCIERREAFTGPEFLDDLAGIQRVVKVRKKE